MLEIVRRSGVKNVVIYLDDVVVFGRDKGTLWEDTKAVIRELTKAGMMMNINKCHFLTTKVDAVGFELG